MRLGCCGQIEQAQEFKDAGFDFLEVNVQSVLQGQTPSSDWDKTAPQADKLALPIEAANGLVPGSMPVVGPKRDLRALQDYMQRVAKRAERLGIRRLVFGSGGARKRPDDVDARLAGEQIDEFTRMAGEVCAHHDVILVIEHLNRSETNTINTLEQARALCDRVQHPSVAVLVDSYHYGLEREHDQAILDLGDRIRHVHVAEPDGRWQPGAGEGHRFDFEHFFCLLRKIGYDERISIEATWTGPVAEKGAACVELLRQAWTAAGRCE